MSVWILILLCVVQGVTEFLPVSSSGHLLFVEQIFGISENTMIINLFLHVSTLLAVVIVYRKLIWSLIKKPFQPYVYKLILATIFSVLLAFIYEFSGIDSIVTKIYPFGFLITSLLLFICHKFQKKNIGFNHKEITIKNSVLVGFVQGVAVIPGISRSGSTITSLILSGNDEKESSQFSFLLSIPIIIGGFVLEVLQVQGGSLSFEFSGLFPCLLALILTFIVSIIALKLTIKLLKKHKFIVFSIYTFLMFLISFTLNYLI